MQPHRLVRRASLLAAASPHPLFRVGAVVAHGGRIIATGTNKPRSHPQAPGPFYTIHAEVDALTGIQRHRVAGATLYVVRLTRDGTLAGSRPCARCWDVLVRQGLRRVYYLSATGALCHEPVG